MLVYLRVCHLQDDQGLRVHRMSHAHQIWTTPVILHQVRIPSTKKSLTSLWRPIRCKNINIKSCNNFCNTCNICHVTRYQSQGQRLPRAMIGPFYDDQMVVFGQRYKQNAINVSGNESKLENVYMGIKIVKTCFGHLSSFIF